VIIGGENEEMEKIVIVGKKRRDVDRNFWNYYVSNAENAVMYTDVAKEPIK
jgi:hypothetical protein